MKRPAGTAKPRRLATPKKQVQLNLRRRPEPEPERVVLDEKKSTFWRWVLLVALFHALVLVTLYWAYNAAAVPKQPEQFMSLLPPGDTVKGTPGVQQAPKVGASTPAPSAPHHTPPPEVTPPKPPTPVAVKPPPTPVTPPTPPKPIVKADTPDLVPDKPVVPKPTPPKPKVKVDLTLADGPTAPADKHVTKPKPHPKKPVAATVDDSTAPDRDAPSNPDSNGLSKEQIAAKLGEKLQAAGVKDSLKIGASGSDHSQANSFADFYAMIHDQVTNKWRHPSTVDETAIAPEVKIHVNKDGLVPPDQVQLTRSSGNAAYDESAVTAAKNLGYLLQPLPDGCPPDIHITFNLTR